MNFRQLFENKTPVTDYSTWSDEVAAAGGRVYPQQDRNRLVAQSWDGETMGEFNLRTNQGYITPGRQGVSEGKGDFAQAIENLHGWHEVESTNPDIRIWEFDDREGGHDAQGTVYYIEKTGRIQIEFEDRDGYHGGDVTDAFNSIGDAMNVLKNITVPVRPNTGKARDFDKLGGRTVAGSDDLYKTDRVGRKGTLNKSRMDTMKASSPYRKTGPEGQLPEQDVDEGLKSKIAGAALAAANLLGSPAAAQEPVKPITIAYVQIDGEVRKYNLGDKFSNAKEAEQFISAVLDKQGISGYTLDIKHGYPKQKTDEAGQGVTETTGDPKFDKMLKGITGKRQVAKQQKTDTKQQARDAFGGMFGGGNPADKLSIRNKGVAEVSDDGYGYKSLSTKQIMKLIQSGNWEAVQDVVPGKHIQLRNNRNGKNTTVHVKQDVAEGFDELDAYIKAKQAPQPSGGAGIKRGSYGMPGRKTTKGVPGARPGGGSTGHTTPGNRDFGRPHSIPRAAPLGIDDYDANYRREVDEVEYKDTVDKSKIPAVQRKAQGGDWKVSTRDLEHERSKSPTGPEGLAKAKQRLGMNENQQLPPEVIELLKKVAQSDAAPEHKKAIINSIMAKYQPIKNIAEEPTRTAREKFNQGLKRAGFDPDAAAKRLTDLIAKQKAEREKFEKENPAAYGDDSAVKEEKVRLDPKCWTGKKIGNPKTKVKGGVRVNNCVPK